MDAKLDRAGLSRSVADAMERDLGSFPGIYLPSSRQLAQKYEVSRPTILKAIRELHEKGLVRLQGNRKARILGRSAEKTIAQSSLSSSEKVYTLLLDRIKSGRYRRGEVLPKWSYLSSSLHVSTGTINQALRKLHEQNIIHRKGRRCIVGPAPETDVRGSPRHVILILTSRPHDWRFFCYDRDTEQFGREFADQAERAGVSLWGITENKAKDINAVAVGQTEVAALVRRLGSRYRGTLIPVSKKKLPNIDEWVHFLSRFKEPVVWFDRNDVGFSQRKTPVSVFRVFISQAAAAREVVRFVHHRGFRKAFFAVHLPIVDWQERRFEFLRAEGACLSPPLSVELLKPDDIPQWRHPVTEGVVDRLEVLKQTFGRRIPEVLREFRKLHGKIEDEYGDAAFTEEIRGCPDEDFFAFSRAVLGLGCSPIENLESEALAIWTLLQFQPVLLDPEKVVIAPRDGFMNTVFRQLSPIGSSVLEKFSFISFDNHIRYSFQAFTSLDFGFSELAYQAFHLILRDLPTRETRDGVMASVPYVVDRGSVKKLNHL